MGKEFSDFPDKTLLRPDEVAAFFRVSVKTVYRWCAKGDLHGIRLKRSLRIYRQSVLEFVAKGRSEVVRSYENSDEGSRQ